jgi:hypothetical protein
MAVIAGTSLTSVQRRATIAQSMMASPERYIAPIRRACSGGTANGRTSAAFAGLKYVGRPTVAARAPTARK